MVNAPTPPQPQGQHRGLFDIMGDSIDIAGHKVPVSILALVATVVGIIVVMRARASGSSVASVGSTSTGTAADTTPDYGSELTADEADIGTLQGDVNQLYSMLSSAQTPSTSTPAGTTAGSTPLGSSSPTQSNPSGPSVTTVATQPAQVVGANGQSIPQQIQLAQDPNSGQLSVLPNALGSGPPPGSTEYEVSGNSLVPFVPQDLSTSGAPTWSNPVGVEIAPGVFDSSLSDSDLPTPANPGGSAAYQAALKTIQGAAA